MENNRKTTYSRLNKTNFKTAFSLIEVTAAVMILGIVTSSVFLVIDRCTKSATDSVLQLQAFEVARNNMETLLSKNSITETYESDTSEKYPAIEWETTVETFYEPITSRMWLRGVCSANYKDSKDQPQTVELRHWITDLSTLELLHLMLQKEEILFGEQIIDTIEIAAQYAGVSAETIDQWIDNGMLTTDDGSFIKTNLDIYIKNNGQPSIDKQQNQVQSEEQIKIIFLEQNQNNWRDMEDSQTGLTYREIEKMSINEIYELITKE